MNRFSRKNSNTKCWFEDNFKKAKYTIDTSIPTGVVLDDNGIPKFIEGKFTDKKDDILNKEKYPNTKTEKTIIKKTRNFRILLGNL